MVNFPEKNELVYEVSSKHPKKGVLGSNGLKTIPTIRINTKSVVFIMTLKAEKERALAENEKSGRLLYQHDIEHYMHSL